VILTIQSVLIVIISQYQGVPRSDGSIKLCLSVQYQKSVFKRYPCTHISSFFGTIADSGVGDPRDYFWDVLCTFFTVACNPSVRDGINSGWMFDGNATRSFLKELSRYSPLTDQRIGVNLVEDNRYSQLII